METISSNRPKIVVIGSCNTDMVVKANRLPVPGETILGGTFYMNPGGKGANQAIAAARLGAEVTFISKIGYDLFGLQALEIYRSEKINTEFIFTDQKSPSGVALISVDSFGENSIIVAPGASRSLSTEDINKAEEKIKEADIILMQLEVPIDTVEYAATIANRYGKKVILNPAPASTLSNSFLNNVHTILPNRIEAEMLSGIKVMDVESAHRAAKAIGEKGIENVVITLGKDGAYVKEKGRIYHDSCKRSRDDRHNRSRRCLLRSIQCVSIPRTFVGRIRKIRKCSGRHCRHTHRCPECYSIQKGSQLIE